MIEEDTVDARDSGGGVRRPWEGRRLHFVGIGGAGMSGLALIAHRLGASVTGSDQRVSEYLAPLERCGIQPALGHSAEHVPAGAEVVYSSAVAADNPELEAGSRTIHRSELLGELSAMKRCIAVAGTHGKTTTTAMVVAIMRGAGLDPAYVVGGVLRETGLNADWGSGDFIVIEADESDRSLLAYEPEIAVLTNAELDHHATYASRLDLEETFARFLSRAETAVVWNRPELVALARGARALIAYDAPERESSPHGTSFRWHRWRVQLAVSGAHNALNAAAALEAAHAAGVEPAAALAAIRGFQGAKRRLELIGTTDAGVHIYDDYAHHPTEVAAAIAGARELAPPRLVAVFQPHLYSRTRAFADRFGAALAAADLCCVLDVYPAREHARDFPGVDGRLVAAACADARTDATVAWTPSIADARVWLERTLRPGDLCLLMGAGDVDRLGRELLDAHPRGGANGAARR